MVKRISEPPFGNDKNPVNLTSAAAPELVEPFS